MPPAWMMAAAEQELEAVHRDIVRLRGAYRQLRGVHRSELEAVTDLWATFRANAPKRVALMAAAAIAQLAAVDAPDAPDDPTVDELAKVVNLTRDLMAGRESAIGEKAAVATLMDLFLLRPPRYAARIAAMALVLLSEDASLGMADGAPSGGAP